MKAVMIGEAVAGGVWAPFHGSRSHAMVEALRALGVEVVEIGLPEFEANPAASLERVLRFRPDFLIGPNFNYPLIASASCPELFELQIPLVAFWDDPVGVLTNYGERVPSVWSQSRLTRIWGSVRARLFRERPAPEYFRAIMRKPHFIHLCGDSGHIQAVEQIGLLEPGRATWQAHVTFDAFYRAGETRVDSERDLAFCGNIYLSQLESSPLWHSPWHRSFTERILQRKQDDYGASGWDLLMDELARTPNAVRRELGLFPDQKRFWDYYVFLTWVAINAVWRTGVLRSVHRPVSLYGMFADPATRALLEQYPNLRFAGNAHHFNELPHVFASTRINLGVTNGIMFQGGTTKQFDCLAAGGFVLLDTKTDLYRVFGKTADAIFVRNAAELNEKIEYYLPRPRERRDIVEALRDCLKRECTLEVFFPRVLERVRAISAPRRAA